ncbi:MAG: aldo/keto reductase [Labilithrix sp.]
MSLLGLLSIDAAARRRALAELSPETPGAPFAVRELLLGDEDATVRASAATWFERERDLDASRRRGAPSLINALYDTHPSVRLAACRALARLNADAATPTLRRLALEEPIWWVRRGAVIALARIEGAAAIPALRAVLDDPFWRVRHAAVRVLLVLGASNDSTIEILDGLEGSDRARGALRYIERRLRRGPDQASSEPIVEQPAGLVADPDPAVITARLERGLAASPAELALYVGDPHEALREAATARLLARPDLRAIRAASIWLEDPRIPHATGAVVALLDRLEAHDADVAHALLDEVLAEPDARPGVTVWALSFIVLNRRWEWVDAMVRAARAESPMVRRSAVAALGAAKRSDTLDTIREALADDDEDVHRLAAHALLHFGEAAAWRPLLELPFEREPALVRRLIVIAAREAGDIGLLRRAAADDDVETRAEAVAALEPDPALASDPDPWIRRAVLDAPAAIRALKGDVDPFLKRDAFEIAARGGFGLAAARVACHDPDEMLRTRAAELLVRSEADEDLRCVLELSRDPSLAVRAAAADVIDFDRATLAARLARVRDTGSDLVRDAANTWLGVRAPALLAAAPPVDQPPTREKRAPRPQPSIASPRALGRTGLTISPLVLSGANEPSVASLFGAMDAGCNIFFWEPRYRSLSTFLRNRRARHALVVAGTYHASASAIRRDVDTALRRLRRDRLDVFLVFWTRSAARLEDPVAETLDALKREGKIRAAGFSTHDRELAKATIGSAPWDVAMIRHSAAHPGAEDGLIQKAAVSGVGLLGFSATNYSRLLREATAVECYQYSLLVGLTACVSAPRGGPQLVENLSVLTAPELDPSRVAELRAHGQRVREESLDFARHIRRFPTQPEAIDEMLRDEEHGLAPYDVLS